MYLYDSRLLCRVHVSLLFAFVLSFSLSFSPITTLASCAVPLMFRERRPVREQVRSLVSKVKGAALSLFLHDILVIVR